MDGDAAKPSSPPAVRLPQARFMLEGLIVEPERMRRNLDLTGGLIVAEAVDDGAGAAHRPGCRARSRLCRLPGGDRGRARRCGTQLGKAAGGDAAFRRAALDRLVDPANYLGSADAMIDRVLAGRSDRRATRVTHLAPPRYP